MTIPVGVASLVYQVLCVSYVLVRVVSWEGGVPHIVNINGSVFRWYVLLSVNEQPVADKHHMTSLLFCLPYYRIQVFSSVVNFSGILFADAERRSF